MELLWFWVQGQSSSPPCTLPKADTYLKNVRSSCPRVRSQLMMKERGNGGLHVAWSPSDISLQDFNPLAAKTCGHGK